MVIDDVIGSSEELWGAYCKAPGVELYPKSLFLSHFNDFNENAHSDFERGIFEVDEKLTMEDIFIDTLSVLTWKKLQE